MSNKFGQNIVLRLAKTVDGYMGHPGAELLFFSTWSFLPFLYGVTSTFLISIALQNHCQKAANFKITKNGGILDLMQLKEEMKALKGSMSAMFFLIFSIHCLLIIQACLNIFNGMNSFAKKNQFLMILTILNSLWELFYLTFIVDKTLETHKSMCNNIRYIMN